MLANFHENLGVSDFSGEQQEGRGARGHGGGSLDSQLLELELDESSISGFELELPF